MDNLDKLRQKIKQFFSDFSGFSDIGKAATIVVAILLLIAAYLFMVKFALWLVLIAIVIVLIKLYFIEHTNQLWRANDARKAVKAVIEGLAQKGFISRNEFMLGKQKLPSEVLRTFNRAVFELEIAKDEVKLDVAHNGNVLTLESQQSWLRYLKDNSERTAFMVDRAVLVDQSSHYILRIIFRDNKNCQLLKRDEVYSQQLEDSDF